MSAPDRTFQRRLSEKFAWFHRHPELAFEERETTGRI